MFIRPLSAASLLPGDHDALVDYLDESLPAGDVFRQYDRGPAESAFLFGSALRPAAVLTVDDGQLRLVEYTPAGVILAETTMSGAPARIAPRMLALVSEVLA